MTRRIPLVLLSITLATLASCAASGTGNERAVQVAGYGSMPTRVLRVAHGPGHLAYRATEDGRIWIGDEDAQADILSRKVTRSDRVEVVTDAGVIKLNNEAIGAVTGANHAIYFRPLEHRTHPPYDGIPAAAERVATGEGRVEWQADRTGRIWVGDDKAARLLVSEPVAPGDLVEVDVENDQVRLNGRIVSGQILELKHAHSVFFR